MRANKRPRSSDHAARRRALADATAGVIGSLASVLAFYPVDVWKTSLQAGVTDGATANAKEECCEENDAPNPKLGNEGSQVLRPKASRLPSSSPSHLSKVPPFSHLFRGLPHKIIHTIVSSFTYFFVYSLVQTKYAAYRKQNLRTHSGNASSSGTTSTATKLLLTAFAAVINTGITLPLDTISSRKQAGTTTSTTSTTSLSGKGKDKQVKPILNEGELGVKKGGNKGNGSKGKANESGPTSYYMPSYEDIANNNGDTAPSLETSDDNSASETNNDGYISARGSFSEEYHSANEEYEDALDGEQNIECTPQNNEQDVKKEDASNNNDNSAGLKRNVATPATATSNNTTKNRHQLYIKSPEKYKFSFSTNLAQEAFATTSRGSSSSFGNLVDNSSLNNSSSDNNRVQSTMSKQKHRHVELKSLWNGLFPALLLCTNPAIQYTMYDTLKNALFQHRMTLLASMKRKEGGTTTGGGSLGGESTSQSNILSNNKLTMWEAFVFGLISKFFATIITYPLIRCKVLLMVSSPEAFLDGGGGEKSGDEDGDDDLRRQNVLGGQSNDAEVNNGHGKKSSKIPSENTPPPSTSASRNNDNNQKRYPRSLLLLLIHIFKNDGVRGIYKGCSLQLLHTILKSALLMMVREKITFVTHQFFQVDN